MGSVRHKKTLQRWWKMKNNHDATSLEPRILSIYMHIHINIYIPYKIGYRLWIPTPEISFESSARRGRRYKCSRLLTVVHPCPAKSRGAMQMKDD